MRAFPATALMGVVALSLLGVEWNFARRARAGRAVIDEGIVYSRGGELIADALCVVDGRPVRAALRSWFCSLRPGQQVRVLYLPSDPGNVVLDRFWQRHYGSVLAFGVFAIVANAEVRTARDRRRRQTTGLLGEGLLEPPLLSRGGVSLPIDTRPRLWDRELDG